MDIIDEKKMKPTIVATNRAANWRTFTDRDLLTTNLYKKVKDPTLKYDPSYGSLGYTTYGQQNYVFPEYNLSEIITITETEPLVARAFNRKEVLCLKEGWDLIGKNPKTVEYIKQRLSEISHVSGTTTQELIGSIARNIIKFSNWFAAIVRDPKFSSGKVFNKQPPIAAIFTIPAETVLLQKDNLGNVIALAQEVNNNPSKRIEFKKEKFLHFHINKEDGYSIGTPTLVPVKDDIIALRRIEENVEILLYQHLFPLFHYKVGTEKAPARIYPDGTTEVDEVRNVWSQLPAEGAIVTPERHDINQLSTKNAAMDAEPYLEYFKKRVLAGLGISSLDIGDSATSNRSTSDSLSTILVDGVKFIQRKIEWQFAESIIVPLLLESSFPEEELLDPENMVFLKFREIDVDFLIKKQNHAAQMYSQHATAHEELRRELGLEPWTEEQFESSYFKKFQEPLELLKSGANDPFSPAIQAAAESESSAIEDEHLTEAQKNKQEELKKQAEAKRTQLTSGQRAGAGVNRPSNQHGTKTGPDGRKSKVNPLLSLFIRDNEKLNPTNPRYSYTPLSQAWSELRNQISSHKYEDISKSIRFALATTLFANKHKFYFYLINRATEGIYDTLASYNRIDLFPTTRIPKLYSDDINKQINYLIDSLANDIESSLKNQSINDVLDKHQYRINLIQQNESSRAYALGNILGLRYLGYKQAIIKNGKVDTCGKCKEIYNIDLYDFFLSNLPPVSHPNAHQIIEPVGESNVIR